MRTLRRHAASLAVAAALPLALVACGNDPADTGDSATEDMTEDMTDEMTDEEMTDDMDDGMTEDMTDDDMDDMDDEG